MKPIQVTGQMIALVVQIGSNAKITSSLHPIHFRRLYSGYTLFITAYAPVKAVIKSDVWIDGDHPSSIPVSFECRADGKPDPDFDWSRHNTSRPTSYVAVGGVLLWIQTFHGGDVDNGIYNCTAHNKYNSDTALAAGWSKVWT